MGRAGSSLLIVACIWLVPLARRLLDVFVLFLAGGWPFIVNERHRHCHACGYFAYVEELEAWVLCLGRFRYPGLARGRGSSVVLSLARSKVREIGHPNLYMVCFWCPCLR